MNLKGGFAYLNMRGIDIQFVTSEESPVYVKNLYRDAIKVYNSKKTCVIYNTGASTSNNPLLVSGYNVVGDALVFKFSSVTTTNTSFTRRLYIKPDSTYYVLSS